MPNRILVMPRSLLSIGWSRRTAARPADSWSPARENCLGSAENPSVFADYSLNSLMDLQFIQAKPEDAQLLASLNKKLIEDEKHRNPMTVAELTGRMKAWLEGGYQATYLRKGLVILGGAPWEEKGIRF
jgi:hypothetical protein